MTDQMIRDRSFREKMRDRDRITDHEQVIGDPDRIILKLVIPPITGQVSLRLLSYLFGHSPSIWSSVVLSCVCPVFPCLLLVSVGLLHAAPHDQTIVVFWSPFMTRGDYGE